MTAALAANLSGKVAVVTGATTGIGKEVARELARLGATVVIGARTPERGEAARREIAGSTGNQQVEVMKVDMAELASVRAFAQEVQRKHPRLYALVNNAGVWLTSREDTSEGHEKTFATNVLGPHLLSQMLLPSLTAGAPSRIVNVASSLANSLDVQDLEWRTRKYDGFKIYATTKQALRMLTWTLAKKLEGTSVTANAVMPGFVRSEFNRNAAGFMGLMVGVSARFFARTPQQGADTVSWAAAAPELEKVSGKLYEDRTEKECKYRDPARGAELERLVEAMIAGPAAAAGPPAGAAGDRAQARA